MKEPDFADMLSGLAEAHHLDQLVNAALVGTEEAIIEDEMQNADDEELMRETLDAVYGPEDEMKADEIEIRDEEADLLEKDSPTWGSNFREGKEETMAGTSKTCEDRDKTIPSQLQTFAKASISTDASCRKSAEAIH